MSISKEFRDHARALLTAKSIDPNPRNLSKLTEVESLSIFRDAVRLGLETKDYWVFTEDSVSNLLVELILSHPFALPSKYLALFLTGAFKESVDFNHLITVAENFKANPTRESKFTFFQLLEMDENLGDHLGEILVTEFGSLSLAIPAVVKMFGFDEVYETTFKGSSYWIFGFKPGSLALQNWERGETENECN